MKDITVLKRCSGGVIMNTSVTGRVESEGYLCSQRQAERCVTLLKTVYLFHTQVIHFTFSYIVGVVLECISLLGGMV